MNIGINSRQNSTDSNVMYVKTIYWKMLFVAMVMYWKKFKKNEPGKGELVLKNLPLYMIFIHFGHLCCMLVINTHNR